MAKKLTTRNNPATKASAAPAKPATARVLGTGGPTQSIGGALGAATSRGNTGGNPATAKPPATLTIPAMIVGGGNPPPPPAAPVVQVPPANNAQPANTQNAQQPQQAVQSQQAVHSAPAVNMVGQVPFVPGQVLQTTTRVKNAPKPRGPRKPPTPPAAAVQAPPPPPPAAATPPPPPPPSKWTMPVWLVQVLWGCGALLALAVLIGVIWYSVVQISGSSKPNKPAQVQQKSTSFEEDKRERELSDKEIERSKRVRGIK